MADYNDSDGNASEIVSGKPNLKAKDNFVADASEAVPGKPRPEGEPERAEAGAWPRPHWPHHDPAPHDTWRGQYFRKMVFFHLNAILNVLQIFFLLCKI